MESQPATPSGAPSQSSGGAPVVDLHVAVTVSIEDQQNGGAMYTNGHQPHIVVIEHAPEIQNLFRELLGEAYRATILGDCPDSVAALKADVIIHDYVPTNAKADLESLRRLTVDTSTSHIPLVLCSAATEVADVAARLQGANVQIVRKPFTLDDMLGAIEDGVRQRHPHDQVTLPTSEWEHLA